MNQAKSVTRTPTFMPDASKKRAVIGIAISVVLSILCRVYFFTEKFVDVQQFNYWTNFLYCAPFFLMGGYSIYTEIGSKSLSQNKGFYV